MQKILRWRFAAVPSLCLLVVLKIGAAGSGKGAAPQQPQKAQTAPAKGAAKGGGKQAPAAPPKRILAELDLGKAAPSNGRMVQELAGGGKAVYTIDPRLQKAAGKILAQSAPLAAALVLVEVGSGRVLAMADVTSPDYADSPLSPSFAAASPAASVFKIVTAAALIAKQRADTDTVVCYHGGSQKLLLSNILDDPARDKACATLSDAMGRSINPVFAKLADKNLSAQELRDAAAGFGFGAQLPLDYPVLPEVSAVQIPEEKLEFARTAAGFWNVSLSPLHGAMIAQAVAGGGTMLAPSLVDEVLDAKGAPVYKDAPRALMQCTSPAVAKKLGAMMLETVASGTAAKHFRTGGKPSLPGIGVAGKTGSLARKEPYRFYSWFVGFAPADKPQVAVAAIVINGKTWKTKGPAVARDILKKYFSKK